MTHTRSVDPSSLSPHPDNARIYGGDSVDDLVESIRQRGILEPLVATPGGVLISGHRRHRAALALGLSAVPVVVRAFEDEVAALVEFNRHRRKTWSQVHAECLVLLPRLRAAAEERRLAGSRAGGHRRHGRPADSRAPRSRVIEDLARCTGVNHERLRRLLRINEAVADGSAPGEIVRRLDAGTLTVHEAHRLVRRAQRQDRARMRLEEDLAAGRANVADMICPFDVWQFPRRDRRFGVLGTAAELIDADFGAPPPQVIAGLLHYFTSPGDLVVDPMAGNGTAADLCRYMGRRCESFDLNPRRAGIAVRDALDGPPPGLGSAALLFLDPPYGDQRRYSEDPRDLSGAASPEAFYEALDRLLELWLPVLRPGGRVGLLMGAEFKGGRMVDRAWEAGKLLERRAGIERRIQTPYPASMFPPYRVARSLDRGIMLSRICELFVARV